MGEVYRARDTRLDRTVAIKIVPQHLSSNPQSRERFDREAKAISSLSHPHICPLYDVGHQDGIDFLVMEYLEGETLAHRIKKGPLPPEQALQYAIQITDALDTAHRHGLIHRDLKPGNIMLTKTGAKLLDFGLAKMRTAEAAAGMTALPTQTTPLTGEGTILGTLQYMAPEQLEGTEADARTDIFALGAVLYEMATGKRAFEGKTKTSLVAAIVSGEPRPISELQPLTPPSLEHVIKKCLAKERDDRWQSAMDIAEELRWIGEEHPQTPKRRGSVGAYAAVLGAALIVGGVIGGYFVVKRRDLAPLVMTEITAPDHAFFDFGGAAPALSPDGSKLAFVAKPSDGPPQLWIRRLDSSTAVQLKGTENAVFPFWSPDSKFVAFIADGKLKRIDAAGGAPETLASAPTARGGAWSKDGVIIFAPSPASPIVRVAASGGEVQPVTSLDIAYGQTSQRFPAFLPDGRHFVAFVQGIPEGKNIFVGSLDSKAVKLILRADAGVVFA